MRDEKLKTMVKTGLFMAIIFVFTYTFKIPVSLTGGYTHLGDAAIFLAVMLLGRKNGTIAAALGGALSDLLGGFVVWVVPTFIIKGLMAWIMGTVTEKLLPNVKMNWLIGAIAGGVLQIIGYTLVKVVMFGSKVALATVPGITLQTSVGIVLASVLIAAFTRTKTLQLLKEM